MSNISRVLNDEPREPEAEASVPKAPAGPVAATAVPSRAPHNLQQSPNPQNDSPYLNPSLSKSDTALDRTHEPHTEPATAAAAAVTLAQSQSDASALKRTLSASSLSPALSPSNLRFKRKKVPSDIRIYPISKTAPPPVNSAPPTVRGFPIPEQPTVRTPVHAPNSANSSSGSSETTPHTAHSIGPQVATPGQVSATGPNGQKVMYYVHPNGVQNPNAIRYYNLQNQTGGPSGGPMGYPDRAQVPIVSPLNTAHPGQAPPSAGLHPHMSLNSGSSGLMTPQPHPHSAKPSPYSKVQVEDIYERSQGSAVGSKTYQFPHYVELQASSPFASSFKKAGTLPPGAPGTQSAPTSSQRKTINGARSLPRPDSDMEADEADDKKERFLKLCGEMWDLLKG